MYIKPLSYSKKTSEVYSEDLSGTEGLAVAVIKRALLDLTENNAHTSSAIQFLKYNPALLEFWLTTASTNLNIQQAMAKLAGKVDHVENSHKDGQLITQGTLVKKLNKTTIKKAEKPFKITAHTTQKITLNQSNNQRTR